MEPIVLGIETSCDETAIGIVRGRTLLANEIASSVDEHARFGGVVPEIASRAHLEAILPSIERAVKDAKISLKDINDKGLHKLNVRPQDIDHAGGVRTAIPDACDQYRQGRPVQTGIRCDQSQQQDPGDC
jgi:hypothetical protein